MGGLLCGCSVVLAPVPTPLTKRLTEADAGHSIELRANDRLEVTLPGNPTTGFQWDVRDVNTTILQPIGESEFEPPSRAVGRGTQITLRFAAVGSGQTELKLIYHRSFEQDVPSAQTFEVTVTVR
jgi:inhibitor of cysteine peptidase